jgi:hypothetical protein
MWFVLLFILIVFCFLGSKVQPSKMVRSVVRTLGNLVLVATHGMVFRVRDKIRERNILRIKKIYMKRFVCHQKKMTLLFYLQIQHQPTS